MLKREIKESRSIFHPSNRVIVMAKANREGNSSWRSIIEKIYRTPGHAAAYSSAQRLKHELHKTYNLDIPLHEIQEWLSDNYSYSIHKPARVVFKRNPIIATHIDQQWQADLLFLPDLARDNNSFKIALVCIDVLSRFAWGELMKSKTGEATTEAFYRILKRAAPRKPDKLQSDKGKEFVNKTFQNLLKDNDIKFFTTNSEFKAAIAERFIRTLKTKIYQYLDDNATNKYIDKFQDLINSYNKTVHSTIEKAPIEVSEENEPEVLRNLYGERWYSGDKFKPSDSKYKVGDYVRVSKVHGKLFRKGYKGNWTDEIFKITSARHRHPRNEYSLIDLNDESVDGVYYDDELQKVPNAKPESDEFLIEKILKTRKLKGRPKEHFVKWKGYSDKFNSWIKAASIKDLKSQK